MPLTRLGGRSFLLFLLLFLMKSGAVNETTPTSDYATTRVEPSTYSLEYTTEADRTDHALDIATTSTADDFVETTAAVPECPDGFDQLTMDWCFHFRYDVEDMLDFKYAQQYCETKNANLPAITSVEVTAALMIERTTTMGISPFESFYIGLTCDTKTHKWEWMNGTEFDPSNAFFQRRTSAEHCSRLDNDPYVFDQFGTWTAYEKFSSFPLVVCATRPASYLPDEPSDLPCSEPWTSLPGGYCYRLSLEKNLSAVDAEKMCRGYFGHLPTIKSAEQSNLILTYLKGRKMNNGQFWIGLYCTHDDESWGKRAWIDGTPFTLDYTNFLDVGDNTTTCNTQLVGTFLYNGALNGQWQKEPYNSGLTMLMCSKTDPEAATTAATTRKTTTRRTTLPPTEETTITTTTDVDLFTSTPQHSTTAPYEEDTTIAKQTTERTTPDVPDDTTPTVVTTPIITTIATTTLEPTTTLQPTTTSTDDGKEPKNPNQQLTKLELILIIALAIVVISVVLIVLVYLCCKRIRKEHVQEMVTSMQKRFSRSNTHMITKLDEWEIKRQFVGIDYSRQLGRGAFGSVYLGRVFSGNIPELAVRTHIQLNTLKKDDDFVAIKTLHESADREATIEFLEEIKIMKKIGFHERLVNILGCVTETEPLLLIVEFCSNGDLLKFMRDRRMFMLKLVDTVGESVADRHSIITHRQQLMFGIQIAYGMEYLSQRGFVHRDIAARNILVDQNETCKIGDFGLCREVGKESDQYISRGGRLPWKWMAPEALEKYYFSVESDIWAFGVLLFEIITLGGNPYPDWAAVELLPRLKSGQRMAKPDICSDAFYEIMLSCWKGVPLSRLSFEKIRRKLAHELEESSSEDYYLKLDGAAKYYQETLEFDNRIGRFNSL